MIVKLDTQRLQTLDQVREFLAGSRPLDLQPQTRAEAYAFVADPATVRLLPPGEGRQGPDPPLPEQGTGLSRAQLTRLLHQHRTTGAIADRRRPRRPFPRRYTKAASGCSLSMPSTTLSGPATRKLCVRALQATSASSASPPSPTDTSTTCATRPAINAAAGRCPRRPAPCTSPSASGASDKGLPAGRFRAQGDLDGIKGTTSTSSTRSPVPVRRLGAHRHALPRPRPRSPAPGVSLQRPRHRQRFGDRRPAASPPHRRVHQVPTPPQQRQRPRREQERLGHPQAPRIRPHPQPLR